MLFDLIQKRRGKETVYMTGDLTKVRDRMKTLRSSQRKGIKGDRVTYEIRPSEEKGKYLKPPAAGFDPSGDAPKRMQRFKRRKRMSG